MKRQDVKAMVVETDVVKGRQRVVGALKGMKALKWLERLERLKGLAAAVACGMVLALVSPVHAQSADDAALARSMDEAYRWMDIAGEENTDAILKASEAYEQIFKRHPSNPLVMAYTGGSRALLAYTTLLPWKKIRHVEDGMALVDKSLALLGPSNDVTWPNGSPVHLETRFVAAKAFLDLPGFFNRGPRGVTLLQGVLDDKRLATAPLILRGQAWLQAAQLAVAEKRPDDARRWARLVVDNRAPQQPAAEDLLKRLR